MNTFASDCSRNDLHGTGAVVAPCADTHLPQGCEVSSAMRSSEKCDATDTTDEIRNVGLAG